MFEIKIKADEVEKKLNELQQKGKNLKPLFNQIGYTLIDIVEENFESESFLGKPWTPLKESTKKQKAKKGYTKTLQNRGHLAESIDFEATNDKLILGTNLEYAPIHQFGGNAGKNHSAKIPARPFLPIDENKEIPRRIKEEILEAVEFYIQELF